jgi:hypothetical protein
MIQIKNLDKIASGSRCNLAEYAADVLRLLGHNMPSLENRGN